MVIERVPFPGKKSSGRWAHFHLVIDEIDIGTIRGTWSVGRDGLAGRGQSRAVAFEAGGKLLPTIADAERWLVKRQLTLLNPSLPAPVAEDALRFFEEA